MIEIGRPDNPKVLIVDDEQEVLNSLADLLRRDFHVFATSDVDEAQRLLGSRNLFSVVISDQRMPIMTGAELLARVAQLSPDTARILLTGYADLEAVIRAVNEGKIVHYITKPWDGSRLLELLRPLAQRHLLVQENRRLVQELARLSETAEDSAGRVKDLEHAQLSLQAENQILQSAHDELKNSYWHLRKIQEVLPICMECGKVKTAEASWEDVVSYLQKHSLFLSHGYCPECYHRVRTEWFGTD